MKVWLIGAGPGDPGLMTIKGREALAAADVIIYDALANDEMLAYAKPDAELIYVGKVAGNHALPQHEINRLLVDKAREKGLVARLKGGDPYVFGRGGEEAVWLADAGIPFEVIPGISSAIAAPAYAGIPLTQRDYVSAVMIITGHERQGKEASALNWQAFAASGATLVFLMGMKNLSQICASLTSAGMSSETPAAVIYRGTTPDQKAVYGSLHDIVEKASAAGLSNPSVIVVGHVVELHDKADWFSQKPLLGKTIVVTRAREQASAMSDKLQELGARVIECPTIRIVPMPDYASCDSALANLHNYGWIIFTSVNGVKYFWERLAINNMDTRSLAGCKVAAIGPATAYALQTLGVKPDLVPAQYIAESVAESLIKAERGRLQDVRILLPRAFKAREALPDLLAEKGALVDVIPMYETRPGQGCMEEVRELLQKNALDCITFASSSTVENFLKLMPPEELRAHSEVKLAAIGPITARTLQKHGLTADLQPQNYTIEALVEEITEKLV